MSYYLFLNELNNKKCFIYLFIFIITNDKMYKKKAYSIVIFMFT